MVSVGSAVRFLRRRAQASVLPWNLSRWRTTECRRRRPLHASAPPEDGVVEEHQGDGARAERREDEAGPKASRHAPLHAAGDARSFYSPGGAGSLAAEKGCSLGNDGPEQTGVRQN